MVSRNQIAGSSVLPDMSNPNPKILIVYNADSGVFNMVAHAIHKTVSPETYPCSLCAVTYGPVSMRGAWKKFLNALPNEVVFHHKDDFSEAYPGVTLDLPAIMTVSETDGLRVLVDRAELDAVQDVDALMPLVRDRLVERAKRLAA